MQNPELTETLKTELTAKIPKMYDKFDDDRDCQRQDVLELRNAIYNKEQKHEKRDDKDSWKFKSKNFDIYELAMTAKAHIGAQTYKDPNMMFGVLGQDAEADVNANIQKQFLVDKLDKMGAYKEFDAVVDDIVEIGEGCFFVGVEERKKRIRRSDELNQINIADKVVYSGTKINRVDPLNFVFDKNRVDDFDSCPKLYRTYVDVYDILNNANYKISSDVEADLLNMSDSDCTFDDDNRDKQTDNNEKSTKDGMLEVIEFWGNLRTDGNKLLENYLIVVVARKYIVRFEENPFINSPFVWCAPIKDPDTGRGISLIRVALSLSNANQNIINSQIDGLALKNNPPYLAPKGCFKGEQVVKPGGIIEYDAALMPQAPRPLDMGNTNVGWEFLNYFSQRQESATGIFKNMTGSTTLTGRTATEISAVTSAQDIRKNDIIDDINYYLIIPMVEKVADTEANFNFDNENIRINEDGQVNDIVITNQVRQGNYKYIYGDKKSIELKKLKYQELQQGITALAQTPAGQNIDWNEIFSQMLVILGYEQPDKYILDTNEKLRLAQEEILLQAQIKQFQIQVQQSIQ